LKVGEKVKSLYCFAEDDQTEISTALYMVPDAISQLPKLTSSSRCKKLVDIDMKTLDIYEEGLGRKGIELIFDFSEAEVTLQLRDLTTNETKLVSE